MSECKREITITFECGSCGSEACIDIDNPAYIANLKQQLKERQKEIEQLNMLLSRGRLNLKQKLKERQEEIEQLNMLIADVSNKV